MTALPSNDHPGWGRLLQAVLSDDAGRRDDATADADDHRSDSPAPESKVIDLPTLAEQVRA